MIERDPFHFDTLVETHQADLRRQWTAAHQGPGPVRLAIGHQLVRFGEWLGGLHQDARTARAELDLRPSASILSR